MNGEINNFLKDNAWSILISIVAVSIAWATLTARINAVEVRAQENRDKTAQLAEITERLIILEQQRLNIENDIDEIKADLKIVKQAVGK